MLRRIALALPLSLALGCGAAPPPNAAPGPIPEDAPHPSGGPAPLGVSGGAAPKKGGAQPPAEPSGAPTSIARAAVTPTDAPLVSTITQSDVLAQVNKSADLFNKCYSIGAGASKTWRAKVTIKATVGPTGNVSSADVMKSTARNARVDACVIAAFKKLSFPRPKDSGTATFTFPLSFDGMEQVP